MKLPRDVSGADLIQVLCKHYGYQRVNQVGSHVVLETAVPSQHRIAVPQHRSLRLGTLNGILRTVAEAQGVDKREIAERLR